jgi:hypothetical protein
MLEQLYLQQQGGVQAAGVKQVRANAFTLNPNPDGHPLLLSPTC